MSAKGNVKVNGTGFNVEFVLSFNSLDGFLENIKATNIFSELETEARNKAFEQVWNLANKGIVTNKIADYELEIKTEPNTLQDIEIKVSDTIPKPTKSRKKAK